MAYYENKRVNDIRKVTKEEPLPQFKATVHYSPGQTEEYPNIPFKTYIQEWNQGLLEYETC